MLYCEIFGILFSFEDKDLGRFSNIQYCTFKSSINNYKSSYHNFLISSNYIYLTHPHIFLNRLLEGTSPIFQLTSSLVNKIIIRSPYYFSKTKLCCYIIKNWWRPYSLKPNISTLRRTFSYSRKACPFVE